MAMILGRETGSTKVNSAVCASSSFDKMIVAMDAAKKLLPSACMVPISVAKYPFRVAILRVLIPKASEKAPIDAKLSAIPAILSSILLYSKIQISPIPPTDSAQISRLLKPDFHSFLNIANILVFPLFIVMHKYLLNGRLLDQNILDVVVFEFFVEII